MVELAYTRDLKSRTRNGFMGSSPIGATIFLFPVRRSPWKAINWCRPSLYGSEAVRSLWLEALAEVEDRSTFVVANPSKVGVGGT